MFSVPSCCKIFLLRFPFFLTHINSSHSQEILVQLWQSSLTRSKSTILCSHNTTYLFMATFSFFFILILILYCYSITVVCLFSPSLHPTPAEPPSLPHLHSPPWFCPCVLYHFLFLIIWLVSTSPIRTASWKKILFYSKLWFRHIFTIHYI